MTNYAENLRRIMARCDIDVQQVVDRSGLHRRTILGILNGTTRPHPRTLRRLADGVGVEVDEFFQHASSLLHKHFDRATNPVIASVVRENPSLFTDWSQSDFDELYSHFGTGGALSAEGVDQVVRHMNDKREVFRKIAIVLESDQAKLLAGLVNALYEQVVIKD